MVEQLYGNLGKYLLDVLGVTSWWDLIIPAARSK